MIKINQNIVLHDAEIKLRFIRSPGPGGQNVNKVATAVELHFNVMESPALIEPWRTRVLTRLHSKMTAKGEIIIKATRFRTQERNKQDALIRLENILKDAVKVPKKRKPTKPSRASGERRLAHKKLQSKNKVLRRKIDPI